MYIVYREWLKGIDFVNSTRKELHSRIVMSVHVHLLHPILARGLTNQQPKKLVSLLAVSIARLAKARSEIQNLLPP